MARMSESPDSNKLAKILVIGDGKIGKSYWAALTAKAGFNILYFDGDVASATINAMGRPNNGNPPALTHEELSRIFLLDVCDSLGGGRKDSKFLSVMMDFSTTVEFNWNVDEERVAKRADVANIWKIRPALMDHNCVLVIDSWTALSESIMTACGIANGVNIANATTAEMRPVYQGGGLKATQMLQLIRSLRCHVIVIGHPDEFSHMTKPEGRKVKDIKEFDLVVDWTKMIPKSTSRPHGLQMAKYFTDVAWMETNGSGTSRMLNFKLKNDRVSGGHFNDSKPIDEYSFANLVLQLGGSLPTGGASFDSWLKICPPVEASNEPAPVLDGTQTSTVKASGMTSLFAKKA